MASDNPLANLLNPSVLRMIVPALLGTGQLVAARLSGYDWPMTALLSVAMAGVSVWLIIGLAFSVRVLWQPHLTIKLEPYRPAHAVVMVEVANDGWFADATGVHLQCTAFRSGMNFANLHLWNDQVIGHKFAPEREAPPESTGIDIPKGPGKLFRVFSNKPAYRNALLISGYDKHGKLPPDNPEAFFVPLEPATSLQIELTAFGSGCQPSRPLRLQLDVASDLSIAVRKVSKLGGPQNGYGAAGLAAQHTVADRDSVASGPQGPGALSVGWQSGQCIRLISGSLGQVSQAKHPSAGSIPAPTVAKLSVTR
jgi:hypothetical protein